MKLPPAEFDTVVTAHSLIAEDVMRVDLARADGADFDRIGDGIDVGSALERKILVEELTSPGDDGGVHLP